MNNDKGLNMGYEVITFVIVAVSLWLFIRFIQNLFMFPRRLTKQIDFQQLLQDKVENYEKYLEQCKENERAAGIIPGENPSTSTNVNGTRAESSTYEEKWAERRKFLDMLKTELKKARDSGDSYDWGNLLDDETKKNADENEQKPIKEPIENPETQDENSDQRDASTSMDDLPRHRNKKNN